MQAGNSTTPSVAAAATDDDSRVRWIDHARGLCIVLIVMLHARYALAGRVEAPVIDWLIELVRPFRLPALFFVSGLFLARLIARPWPDFIDRRVLHYLYFYALWATIEFVPEATGMLRAGEPAAAVLADYGMRFVAPHGPLWFIYALPFFFIAAKLLRRFPAWLVLAAAAVLSIAAPDTGWVIGDRLASRFVYFYGGYVLADQVFRAGPWLADRRTAGALLLAAWAVAHGALVFWAGSAGSATGAFALGVAGTAALLLAGALLAAVGGTGALGLMGRRSLIVYLAFPLLLIVMRKLLQFAPLQLPGDLQVLLVVAGSILGALLIHRLLRDTRLRLLFVRPSWARWGGRQAAAGQPSLAASRAQPAGPQT